MATLALAPFAGHAQELPIPQLRSVFPSGARQGTTVEVELNGNNFDGTSKLYFSEPGLTAELISDPAKLPARFKITVGPEVPVGDYDIRAIATAGISNPRTFTVSDQAELNETEPNDSRAQATRVPLESVVNGRIGAPEDIDWFVFTAKKGQRVLIECRAQRIDSRLDGTLTLYSPEGKELIACQDANIRDQKRDPFIDFDVPADGDYTLRFTDFMYDGGPDYFYRLSIGPHPYLDFITPTGAKPGTTAQITCYGRNLPGGEKTDIKVNGRPLEKVTCSVPIPAAPEAVTGLRFHELLRPPSSRLDGMEMRIAHSNARLLLFSQVPELLEQEPNDTIAQAQRLEIPCAVTGQFSAPKDADYYVFSAKKDEKFLIQATSERLGSPADPDLEIMEPDGRVLFTVTDTNENIGQLRFFTNTRDVVYSFTAPHDGDFLLHLEHVYIQVQGGAQYQYRLQVERQPAPDFRLVCSPAHDIHIDTHAVYQGGRQRLDILAWRMNGHDDPITVEAKNLPPGVTADPIVIGPGMKWGTLIVTAAPDAPIGEGAFEVIGTSEHEGQNISRAARGGVIVWDTVNTPAVSRLTRSIVLAVREKTPFAVTLEPNEFTLKPGQPINLTIKANRRDDMPSAIQLNGSGFDLPPGITIPTTTLPPGQTELKLALTTTDKLKEGTYSLIVNAEAQVPNGTDKKTRVIYPSNPLRITVAK